MFVCLVVWLYVWMSPCLFVFFLSIPLASVRFRKLRKDSPPSGNGKSSTQKCVEDLGGGFKYFLVSPRKLGKISNLTKIFQMGGSTTN